MDSFHAKQYEAQAIRQRHLETLLPSMEARLSAVVLPVGPQSDWLKLPEQGPALWTLWEVQQAVANAVGVNIMSDCYWQPRRPLLQPGIDAYLDTPSPQQMTALAALRGAAFGGMDPSGELFKGDSLIHWPTRPAWEWGDAGTFLRFRSTERDLWRASLLPTDAVAALDDAFDAVNRDMKMYQLSRRGNVPPAAVQASCVVSPPPPRVCP